MSHEEMSFCELKNKEIVNEVDGRRLGKTCDMIFSPRTGAVLGIVAPFSKRGLFLKGQEVFIPFKHISKIGPDVILVRLTPELSQEDGCVSMGRKEKSGRFETHRAAARTERGSRGDFYGRTDDESYGRESHGRESHGRDGRDYYDNDGEIYGEPPQKTQRGAFNEGDAVPDCDFKCEKCMLFDCNKRWKGNSRQKKQRPPQQGESGSAYVDGKLYETSES